MAEIDRYDPISVITTQKYSKKFKNYRFKPKL